MSLGYLREEQMIKVMCALIEGRDVFVAMASERAYVFRLLFLIGKSCFGNLTSQSCDSVVLIAAVL